MKKRQQRGISRRGFMKGLGIGLAAPYIIPAAALGKGGAIAPSERIVVAHIGTGSQGRGLMGGVLGHKSAQLVAVCDVNTNNSAQAKEKTDGHYENTDCQVYTDFREVLTRKDIDAVVIATPDHWHAILCVQAAYAGKAIYCEKPLTWCLEEGRAVSKAVKKNDTVFQVGSMQRSFDQMKQACELVRNGCLGKIHHIDVGLPDGGHDYVATEWPAPPAHVDYDFWVGPAQWMPYHPKRLDWDWRWFLGFGGGQMLDWIGHHGDIAHMGMDWGETGPRTIDPVNWHCHGKSNIYNDPSSYKFNSTYADGTTMTVASTSMLSENFTKHNGLGTQFFGENGQWIHVSRKGIVASDPKLLKIKFGENDFRFRRERNHMKDFLTCIRTGEETAAPAEAGHRSASIGHLGKIACLLKQKLEWDPKKEKFIGNDAANRMLGRPYRGEWTL